MNPFKPAINPRKSSYCLFTIYILVFILRYVLVIVFMLPHFAIELSISSILFFFLSLSLFITVNQKDPGFIQTSSSMSLKQLYEKYHSDSICPFCQIKIFPKSRHCQYCNKCVKGYDHHCP